MTNPVRGRHRLHVVLLILCLGVPVASGQTLPEGPGAEVARARCVTCHETDLIVQQRLSRTGWEREVDKMVRWGAVVPASERTPLVEYLSTHFAPTPAASHAPGASETGEATYTRACLTCHGRDLVEQQRLSSAGWAREVDKMIRWGAVVPAAEKDGLVAYLAARYR